MRSTLASIPHDSRTRSAGTAAAEPSTDWCVIACGTSISDSTPPSDSASEKTLGRRRDPRSRRDGGTRPCRRSPASARPRRPPASRSQLDDRAARSRRARATRRCSVRSPRWTRKQSNGPGHRADRVLHEADLLVQRRVARRSPRRRRRRSARRGTSWSSARRRRRRARAGAGATGVANVLSTTTSALRLRSITPARSITLSGGLVGVSTQIERACRRGRRARPRRGRAGRPCRTRGRSARAPCRRAGRCRRRGRRQDHVRAGAARSR